MMTSTEPRVILVTGATRGLGRALVEGFIDGGHTVIGCGRNEKAIAELTSQFSAPHSFSVVDVTDDSAVRAWAVQILMKYGAPDLLINNAALMNRPEPLWEIPAREFDELTAVNINGVANVIRAFVPAMVIRRQGVIVNLSSGWGRSTAPKVAPYCASKFAVEGLTLALAQELPKGMAAVPVNPGIIDTDMLRQCWGEDAAAFPRPREWRERAVPFLLSLSARDNGRSLTI